MNKILLSLIFISSFAYADEVTIPTVYQTNGQVTSANLNGNFNALASTLNGGLDNNNANASAGYRFVETKSSLPSAGNQGRIVALTSDNSLNFDTGSVWKQAIFPAGSVATGVIPYYSSGWQILSPGTQYYSLVSNGTSSNPSYQQVSLVNGVSGNLPVTKLNSGTNADATHYWRGDGSWSVPPDLNTGNLLFEYIGQVETQGASRGEIVGLSLIPDGGTGNYRFLQSDGSSYVQIAASKFIKIAGISTVTVWARIWTRTSNSGGGQANLKVDIGGVNGNVSGTSNQLSPEWKSFSFDVSSLINGTSYDVAISLKNSGANGEEVYCSNFKGFGS